MMIANSSVKLGSKLVSPGCPKPINGVDTD